MKELLSKHVNNNFRVLSDIGEAPNNLDIIFFTLGTGIPVYPDKLDLSEIEHLLGSISEKLDAKVYVFRTTLPIGTIDFLSEKYPNIELAFVPERLIEGDAIAEESRLPKIIGTYSDQAFETLKMFFSSIGGGILRVKNPRTAEFCKLTDNSYRNLTFAFSNDLAITAEHNKVDVYEVIESVNYGYNRNNIKSPGFVSGYCLGKDPYIFEYAYPDKELNNHSIIYSSRKNNDYLYEYFSDKIFETNPKTISIFGLSFKADVDDFRMSHSGNIITKIKNKLDTCQIQAYDPYMNNNDYTNQYKLDKSVIVIDNILDDRLYKCDLLIILTPHSEIRTIERNQLMCNLEKFGPRVLDAWNAWSDLDGRYDKYNSFGRGK